MKSSPHTIIAPEKLTQYLLVFRQRNDKSQWLAQAGYSLANWQSLENSLRSQILPLDALIVEETEYGQIYEIKGKLNGPNGKELSVCTIWLTEWATNNTKFITLYPDK
jgi:hypothetical protein